MITVVKIALDDGSHGSGFYISENVILTCYHVIKYKRKVKAITYNYDELGNEICTVVTPKKLISNERLDLAFFWTPLKGKPVNLFRSSEGDIIMYVPNESPFVLSKIKNFGLTDDPFMNMCDFYEDMNKLKIPAGTSGCPIVSLSPHGECCLLGMHWGGGKGKYSYKAMAIPRIHINTYLSKNIANIEKKIEKLLKSKK